MKAAFSTTGFRKKKTRPTSITSRVFSEVGGGTRIRTGDEGFAGLCLTTWLCRRVAPFF